MNHYYTNIIEPLLNGNTYNLILFLQNKGILKRIVNCEACNLSMTMKKYARNKDGYAFRCMNKECTDYKNYVTIRRNSFFDNFTIPINVVLKLIWRWGGTETQKNILRDINVTKNTIIKLFEEMRWLCETYYIRNPITLGGTGIICQVDESLLRHKPKAHRGRATSQEIWVMGIADTSYTPSKIFLTIVEKRDAETMLPLINSVCRDFSIIVSDEWRAYNGLVESNLWHLTVNHSLHFVNPETGVHTQNIESCWANLKYKMKMMKGIIADNLESYLFEWMFKTNEVREDFEVILDLIKNYY